MKIQIRKALALSPHTDDSFLGAGGFIHKLTMSGAHVTNVVFSTCDDTLIGTEFDKGEIAREDREAAKKLGVTEVIHHDFENKFLYESRQEILDILYPYRQDKELDLVLAPYLQDVHQDHATIAQEAVRAFTRNGISLVHYPIIGTCKGFNPNIYVPLTEVDIKAKLDALSSYKTQFKLRGQWFSTETFLAEARANSVFVDSDYAEAFIISKGLWEIG